MEELEQQALNDIDEATKRFRKPERLVKLYASFFDTYDQLLETCREQSINSQYNLLAITLHTIKGASLNIQMSLISSLAIKLEQYAKAEDNNFNYTKEIYTLKMYGELYKNHISKI